MKKIPYSAETSEFNFILGSCMRYCLLTCFLLVTFFSMASDHSRLSYLELIKENPHLIGPLGDASRGEIEIILNEDSMKSIEKNLGRDIGIVAQDKYWTWINDACKFPSGHEGIYGRMLWTQGLTAPGSSAVAILPVLSDGRVVINCNFRHATRSWELELPRGGVESNESPEEAARREALEETGMIIDDLSLLGSMPPDSGVAGTIVNVFMAHVKGKQEQKQEQSEAIEEILSLSIEEIKQAFKQGFYECTIRGQKHSVLCRDPFLAYALLIYELQD